MPVIGYSYQASSVTQRGITFTFNTNYEVGTFANGDYWVWGPVTITAMTPAYTGSENGWEVNPEVGTYHGFDAVCKYETTYDSTRVPSLPYTSTATVESIVKIISNGGIDRPCVATSVVLTVVGSIPANDGSTVFRPPYVGTTKPFYNT